MPRYPKQDDPKGKKVIPSVTEIISDCTDSKGWAMPYVANQSCEWIRQNCPWDTWEDDLSDGYYTVTENDLRKKHRGEKDYPNNARYAHKHHSQKALDVGSEVHGLVEEYLKDVLSGKEPDAYTFICTTKNEQVQNAFIAFSKWAEDNELKPISIEKTVYGNGWAGTLDFFGYLNGKLYVLDWKSSKALYPEMRYQIAAYRSETPRMKQIDQSDDKENWVETGCGILRLDKETGMPEFKDTSKSYEKDLSIFNAMVELYFARHPIIRKNAGR